MQKPTSLALVLALALTTATGCGNSAREDALEVIDRVETSLHQIHGIYVEANDNIIATIPELQPCHEQPNVQGVALGALPFRAPSARRLQVETRELRRQCERHRRTIVQRQRRLLPDGGMEALHERLKRVRSRIQTGPEDELRRIMEEADSDEARFQRLARFNDPTAELAVALLGEVEMPSLDLERARETVEQEADAILAAYDDYRDTANRMSETAGEARRLHDEYMEGR